MLTIGHGVTVLQRDQALAAAAAAAASAREASSLPSSPSAARALRSNLSGGPHSTGSVTSPVQGAGLSSLVIPGLSGRQLRVESIDVQLAAAYPVQRQWCWLQ